MILVDDERQGLWDKIASTVVVDEAQAEEAQPGLGAP
jgi:hypothetical protein